MHDSVVHANAAIKNGLNDLNVKDGFVVPILHFACNWYDSIYADSSIFFASLSLFLCNSI